MFLFLLIPCSACEFVVVCNPLMSSIFDPGCMFPDMSCLVSQRKTLMSTWFNIKGRVPKSRAQCQRGNVISINKKLQILDMSCSSCLKRRGSDEQNSAHFTRSFQVQPATPSSPFFFHRKIIFACFHFRHWGFFFLNSGKGKGKGEIKENRKIFGFWLQLACLQHYCLRFLKTCNQIWKGFFMVRYSR